MSTNVRQVAAPGAMAALTQVGIERLQVEDAELHQLLEKEYLRQQDSLSLVASCSTVDPTVLVCEGSPLVNVTAEGYPRNRFHAGCRFVDEVEQLAIDRAKRAFKATYANVQPHSASVANEVVLFSLLNPGDTFLGMRLDHGGHLTHGSKASVSGRIFNAVGYGLTKDGFIDYEEVYNTGLKVKPKLIICGATAHPRTIDFHRFRQIADALGAYLMADISHVAGLVVAGLHPSPIDHAHITTTCTHKQMFGPRGGLILMGKDRDTPGPDGKRTLAQLMQSGLFPLMQGAPVLNSIAAKARTLARVVSHEFVAVAERIVSNAAALAKEFKSRNYEVITGGSDNHIVLMDVSGRGMSGLVAERALEDCNIIVNKNKIPGDTRVAGVASGIRLGTNNVAFRNMGRAEMNTCVDLIDMVLRSILVQSEREYELSSSMAQSVRASVRDLCRQFPIPTYPTWQELY
jgi:glycine hydroxymethyltransferase